MASTLPDVCIHHKRQFTSVICGAHLAPRDRERPPGGAHGPTRRGSDFILSSSRVVMFFSKPLEELNQPYPRSFVTQWKTIFTSILSCALNVKAG